MKTRLIRIIIVAALFTISFAASAQVYIGGSIHSMLMVSKEYFSRHAKIAKMR